MFYLLQNLKGEKKKKTFTFRWINIFFSMFLTKLSIKIVPKEYWNKQKVCSSLLFVYLLFHELDISSLKMFPSTFQFLYVYILFLFFSFYFVIYIKHRFQCICWVKNTDFYSLWQHLTQWNRSFTDKSITSNVDI